MQVRVTGTEGLTLLSKWLDSTFQVAGVLCLGQVKEVMLYPGSSFQQGCASHSVPGNQTPAAGLSAILKAGEFTAAASQLISASTFCRPPFSESSGPAFRLKFRVQTARVTARP